MVKRLFISLILLSLSINLNSSINYISNEIKEDINNEFKLKNQILLFNKTKEFIKKHEGFRSKPYICAGGYRTNGYGFITKYLQKEYRDYITIPQANQVLDYKLKRCLDYTKQIYPNLNYNQALAVAHLGYAKGFGSIKKHELHKQLLEGVINDSTWIYFGKYEIKYESYKANREFELNMFKNDTNI